MDSCNDLIQRRIIFDAKDGIDAMHTFDMQSFCFDKDQQISLTIDFKFDTPLDRDVDTTFHWMMPVKMESRAICISTLITKINTGNIIKYQTL